AIKLAKMGTAAGMAGCPYKVWKMLNKRHRGNARDNCLSFNVVKTMALVFQDLQKNG
ncbi:hypothetical protein BJV74DRAFT_749430, partial [Russula compacta]